MSARFLIVAVLLVSTSDAASYRTPNFMISAPTAEMAEKVGKAAEVYRVELAKEWLGRTLPQWNKPCKVRVKVGNIGAGGATSFQFMGGEVFGWTMSIQGPFDRVLDSVLPHEISHTIFACHFRRPLPRWADEGAATLVEHDSEQHKQRMLLRQYISSGRHYRLRTLFAFKEYPKGMHNVLKLYAQGFSVVDYLILRGGKRRFLAFLNDANSSSWTAAIRKHFGDESIEHLEKKWLAWYGEGSPRKRHHPDVLTAQLRFPGGSKAKAASDVVIRSQSPKPSDAPRTFAIEKAKPKPKAAPGRVDAPDPRTVAVKGNPAGKTTASRSELSLPVRQQQTPAKSVASNRPTSKTPTAFARTAEVTPTSKYRKPGEWSKFPGAE